MMRTGTLLPRWPTWRTLTCSGTSSTPKAAHSLSSSTLTIAGSTATHASTKRPSRVRRSHDDTGEHDHMADTILTESEASLAVEDLGWRYLLDCLTTAVTVDSPLAVRLSGSSRWTNRARGATEFILI